MIYVNIAFPMWRNNETSSFSLIVSHYNSCLIYIQNIPFSLGIPSGEKVRPTYLHLSHHYRSQGWHDVSDITVAQELFNKYLSDYAGLFAGNDGKTEDSGLRYIVVINYFLNDLKWHFNKSANLDFIRDLLSAGQLPKVYKSKIAGFEISKNFFVGIEGPIVIADYDLLRRLFSNENISSRLDNKSLCLEEKLIRSDYQLEKTATNIFRIWFEPIIMSRKGAEIE